MGGTRPVRVSTREFMRASLRGKLCVHARVFVLFGTRVCTIFGLDESLNHALRKCQLYTIVRHVMEVYWSDGVEGVTISGLFSSRHYLASLESPPGMVIWLAHEAF